VEWNAPALEFDASRQIEIVDAMINRWIPVAIFDSAIDTEKIVNTPIRP
jgi:hypothetical protein